MGFHSTLICCNHVYKCIFHRDFGMFWSLPKLYQFLLPVCWQVRATLSILLTDVSKMYDDDQETISVKTNIDSIISHRCSLVCYNVIICVIFSRAESPYCFGQTLLLISISYMYLLKGQRRLHLCTYCNAWQSCRMSPLFPDHPFWSFAT